MNYTALNLAVVFPILILGLSTKSFAAEIICKSYDCGAALEEVTVIGQAENPNLQTIRNLTLESINITIDNNGRISGEVNGHSKSNPNSNVKILYTTTSESLLVNGLEVWNYTQENYSPPNNCNSCTVGRK